MTHGVRHALFAHNADKVDGKHAVVSGADVSARAKKLVATDAAGYLPSNITQKAPDSDLLDDLDPTAYRLKSDESVFAFGQIREDASIRRGSGRLVSVDHPARGPFTCPTSGALAISVVNTSGAYTDGRFSFMVP